MTQRATITDSHCHLDFADFDSERDQIVARAVAAGVGRMVTICTRLQQEPQVRKIAETYQQVFYVAGTHPMSVGDEPMATLEHLIALSQHPKLVGIGESGLDYYFTSERAKLQKQSLQIHIEAAQTTGLPLVIHARAADDDIRDILSAEHRNAPYSCVMHCFSSGPDLATRALDLGFYLSMSGIAAFPKSQPLRDIFAAAPIDRILVETDSPYLAPPPFRSKRNEPSYSVHTAKVGASIFGLEYDDFAHQTELNFNRLFTKVALFEEAL
ncbi:MAG: TatD family hydrolase [Paracoccaceae bacterium]|nr:TatD family hydrolase [Paracoccaceae bacterium]